MFAILASKVIYVGKIESCIIGEYSYECYYKWHRGSNPGFWHLTLISDVPHVKTTEHIHALCYILICLWDEAKGIPDSYVKEMSNCVHFLPFSPMYRYLRRWEEESGKTGEWLITHHALQPWNNKQYLGTGGTGRETSSLQDQMVNIFGFWGSHRYKFFFVWQFSEKGNYMPWDSYGYVGKFWDMEWV